MLEVRFHGRGGQGAVTASRILAAAFVNTGRFGASFPMFGFERRGAPVTAFGRFGDEPIRLKTQIYNPDVLVVLDPSQRDSAAVWNGLNRLGMLVLNCRDMVKERKTQNLKKACYVDASGISMEEIGMDMPNSSILGAFAAATGVIGIDPIVEALADYFDGKKLQANARCARRGYEEAKIIEF
jgi:2-oxoacid:acceptor oxidoreductase gamma subunit (pyruvate/2-ketoisovalerate family)